MQLTNAYRGVKRIYTAQLLQLLAAILALVAALEAILALTATSSAMALGAGFFLLIASALGVIGFVLNIMGIHDASQDEATFRKAMAWVIVGIFVALLSILFQRSDTLSTLAKAVTTACDAVITIFVITGVVRLADGLGNEEVRALGKRSLRLIAAAYGAAFASKLLSVIAGLTGSGTALGLVMDVVAGVLSIAASLLYLRLLSEGKAMLEPMG